LIHPVILYGSETWVLTEREEKQLIVFERKVLRTICGQKIENGIYRRRYNHEIDKEFNSLNALNVTKTSRLRYASHIVRRPKDLPQKALFRARKEKSRKTEVRRSSSTGLNQVLVVVLLHK
jgi:stalled ribosome alternative rescue factor ArfA